MRKILAVALLFVCLAVPAFAQSGSSAEQRKWAVETTRWLEQHPLDRDTKAQTTKLLKWWTEVPDLTLSVCPLLMETKNKKIAPTAFVQATFGAGAYLIEHPDATRADLSFAGVQSALRAYAVALAADPKMRDEFLDGLVKADREGTLRDNYIREVTTKCEESANKH